MLWSGIVYRNNKFGTEGTIDVMLYQKFTANGASRAYSKPINKVIDKLKSALGIGKSAFDGGAITCKCLVLSGNGNSDNAGQFSLPQVGTFGLVAEIGDKARFKDVFYVWLGGLYGDRQYGKNVKLPSDDTINDELENNIGEYETVTSLYNKVESDTITQSEYINKGAYIIKTKTNSILDYDKLNADELTWSNILPENTFILTRDKAALRHDINDYNENKKIGIEQLYFDTGKIGLKRKIKNNDDLLEQDLIFDDDKMAFTMTNGSDSAVSVVILNDGNVQVSTTGDLKVTADKNINFEAKGDLGIKTDGKMTLEATDKMTLEANGQSLGKQTDNLAQAVATLITQGSPATQSASPETVNKGTQVSNAVSSAFE